MKQDIETDKQLLREEDVIQKAKRDPECFRPLYEKYFKKIFLFVLHRVGEKSVTADLTSQVFLKALQKLPSYEFRGFPFSSWLYRIAINECNDFFRKTKRGRVISLEEEHAESIYEEMFCLDRLDELKLMLPRIMGMLSEEELQFIQLRFFDGRPFKEVADILDVSENYAKVKTYRILEKMKKHFGGV